MKNILLDAVAKLSVLSGLCEAYPLAQYPLALGGVPPSIQGLIGGALAWKLNKTAIFVTSGEGEAEKIADCLRGILSENEVAILPAQDLVFDAMDAAAADAAFARIRVLGGCIAGKYRAVVTTADGFASLCPDPKDLEQGKLVLSVGQSLPMHEVISFLEDNGYTRLDMVEGAGSYAVRGSIIDIFAPEQTEPVRIDFFDTDIDGMGFFDPVSQRRSEQIDRITIGAAVLGAGKKNKDMRLLSALKNVSFKDPLVMEKLQADIEVLENGLSLAGRDRYLPLEMGGVFTLRDYLPDALMVVCDYGSMRERFEFLKWQLEQDGKRMIEEHLPFFAKEKYFVDFEDFADMVQSSRAVLLSTLSLSGYLGKLSFLQELSVRQDALTRNDPDLMAEEIREALKDKTVFFCTGGKFESIGKMLAEMDLPFGQKVKKGVVCLLPETLLADCEIGHSILLLGDKVSKKSTTRRTRRGMGEKIKSFADITPGDLVVHLHHGIGVYRVIRRVDNHGIIKDYLTISYDKGDTLYVPTNQLDLIAKYMGTAEDTRVKLSRLGSGAWEKAKAKAKNQTRILAKELIELYARRKQAKGFAFSPDTDWQRQFEDNFAYVETDDQIRCIAEIKEDMEKPYPMDRLLCGDVGFGKTEVALRAIFKAVVDSKQAAILVPTTILSQQHYKTILSRLRGFPIKVEVLNRFKKPKQQQEILRRLRRGEIDIIVGTHRLLQKDIVFKDLGLLVVDEEQRFGVKHKEAIKSMAIGVDVLTLSATPIPRTLNMALSGIRDMSMIEEAPADRYPVATYVLEYDRAVIMGAIRREMRRHGCVYYLKNNIEELERIAASIHEEIPAARVAIAHGQMQGGALENIWQQVLDREVDVLLCTTIIETGVDVSFANTLIIEDADRMGLAQLHQIRGRIGRSNIRAYAYLTYHIGREPSEIAAKRLMTIKEFTAFGSGFKIAMRDLEIRGAGSVLGERQHGHLNTVGYDMYMRLLNEAVAEEKGDTTPPKSDCQMDIAVSAFLPVDYVEREEWRIDLYKKIAAIENREDLADITDELCDRFGEPPSEVLSLMRIALLRGTARRVGVSEIKQKGQSVLIFLERGEPERLFAAVRDFKGRLRLSNAALPYLTLFLKEDDIIEQIQGVIDYISE